MRKVCFLAALAFVAPTAYGQEFTSPEDLLSSLYYGYLSGGAVTNFEPYFSDRLTAEMGGGRLPQGTLERLGFDPMTGVSEAELITVFNLETLDTKGLTATSAASFKVDGVSVVISFDLVREQRYGWQIDHVRGTAGEVTWCSSDLVAAVQEATPD